MSHFSKNMEDTFDLLGQLAEPDYESEEGAEQDGADELKESGEEGEENDMKRKGGINKIEPPAKHHKGDGETRDEKYFLPPTAEELTALRETQMLYHSNLFRLQLKELFTNNSIKTKNIVRIKQWISDFSEYIKGLSNSGHLGLEKPKWIEEHNLVVPLHVYNKFPKHGGIFEFVPPTSVEIVGSYAFDLLNKNEINIDLALILPKSFFHKKDLYNGRWIVLRALYLSWLSKQLKASDLVDDMEWTLHGHCDTRPILKVSPRLSGKCSFNVYLYPVPPEDTFSNDKFTPSKALVLSSFMFEGKESEEKPSLSPTPYYNWTCGIDVMMMKHNNFIKSKLQDKNVIDGLKLLRIWWKQRDFDKGLGGMSFHVVIMYTLYLLEKRKLNEQMSDYQVFRTVLLAFVESDWCLDGSPSLFEEELKDSEGSTNYNSKHYEMSKHYKVVFVDHAGALNLAGQTAHYTYKEIKSECRKAITVLESSTLDSFESLFLIKKNFYLAFDQFIKFRFNDVDYARYLSRSTINADVVTLDYLMPSPLYIWKSIFEKLEKGLAERVDLIGYRRPLPKVWKLNQTPPEPSFKCTFGLLLNEHSFDLLTKGPSADSPLNKSFREFWGEISDLRRFKDGSFHEAVLWGETNHSTSKRREIPFEVCKYVMKYQLGINGTKMSEVSKNVEDIIRIEERYKLEEDFGTGEELLQSCTFAFDSLCMTLKNVELPLKISTIVSTSDVTRHSCVFPPFKAAVPQCSGKETEDHKSLSLKNVPLPYYRHAIDGLIFLEMSGKWPDDIDAVQAIKVEFMCSLAANLRKQGITCVVFPNFIQIIWSGYIFRLKLCHRREIYIRRLVSIDNIKMKEEEIEERDTQDSLQLEVDIEILPRLTTSLNSVRSQHPCYSSSVRLILRWVSSHMLLRHINPITIELLCAHLFLRPEPYSAPCTAHVALFRFMNLVATTDWNATPVLVNVGGEFSANDESEILKLFTEHRANFPQMFVCSPCELRGSENDVNFDAQRRFCLLSTWTKNGPVTPVLSRFRSFAKAGLNFYEAEMKKKVCCLKSLFISPMDDYDILICLRPKKLVRYLEKADGVPKGKREEIDCYEHSRREEMPVVEFDPVRLYLNELEATFSEHCIFFHDIYGGEVIGVVFKPNAKELKDLKVTNLQGDFITPGKKSKMSANFDAIVKDFEFMGKGIVKLVEVRNENK